MPTPQTASARLLKPQNAVFKWCLGGILIFFSFSTHTTFSQPFTKVWKNYANDSALSSAFGYDVAMDGDYAVVGAIGNSTDANGNNPVKMAGAAYIFQRNQNGSWRQIQKITAADRQADQRFGWSVAIQGNTILVSAVFCNYCNTPNDGAIYVFEKTPANVWNQVQKIKKSNPDKRLTFGLDIALDGNYFISAEIWSFAAYSDTAFIRAFENVSGVWTEVQRIKQPPISFNSTYTDFGWRVSLSGKEFIAYTRESNNYVQQALLFERDNSGAWIHKGNISPTKPYSRNDFGANSMCLKNNRMIIGACRENNDENGLDSIRDAGAAYIFERNGSGNWIQTKKLVPKMRYANCGFGQSVSIDGDYAMVSCWYRNHNDTFGKLPFVYVYKYNATSNDWEEYKTLNSPEINETPYYGWNKVAISATRGIVGFVNYKNAKVLFLDSCFSSDTIINTAICETDSFRFKGKWLRTSGNYYDTLTNAMECDSFISLQIKVNPNPKFSLNKVTRDCEIPAIIEASPTNFKYSWQGTAGGAQFSSEDTGYLVVAATDTMGCETSKSIYIRYCITDTMRKIPKIWVPTSFTPDNNGKNEKFGPIMDVPVPFTINIYSRWGQRLFSEENKFWDGEYQGKICPSGVYVYIISVDTTDQLGTAVKKNMKGNFTLLH